MEQEAIEKVLLTGDLAALTVDQRLAYYKSVCDSLHLNPLTQPFGYITFEGRLQLYARKDATEQLRKKHKVSITELTTTNHGDVYLVSVKAQTMAGRTDMATGVVSTTYRTDGGVVKGLTGAALANAMMKAETKAKRRVTLSICGLGMMDESEVEDLETRPPLPPSTDIIKRNVEQATANALPPVTENNYGDVVVHIGKAEGNMLGRKVSELHDNILEWLHSKWRDRLSPLDASDQDMKLKLAVEHEWERRKAAPRTAPESSEASPTPQGQTLSRTFMLDDLRGKINELIMTPRHFMGYLQLSGFNTTEGEITKLSDDQLSLLLRDWPATKQAIEAHVKPVTSQEEPKKKKGRAKK